MKEIIEKQKVNSFLNKLQLEWPSSIDHYNLKTESLAFIYLQDEENPKEFLKHLFPKMMLFVDFEVYLELMILNLDGQGDRLIYINRQSKE
ncbi:hypothetical protein [Pedobacter jejuensis]|uniref:Uncharacterized protein n=1 Tax=Pedobacter jejuensis TaxID=1268550 RepID=A0A3N0BUL3_9SPHI|nr:hypothetical protein [Pedobacter jejuensis]RNL53034.1 hypothetical protein D7004_10760 [Pedobacter jejuensis]